jgi:esterase/lipase superfamily enzyme
MNGLKLSALLLTVAVIVGCAGSGPRKINLMPAPAVFSGGAIDILPKDQPPLFHNNFNLLYATDRKPSVDLNERPFYENKAGFIVRLGRARIQAGGGVDWQEARRITLSKEREGEYPLMISSVEETGVLESTRTLLTQTPEISAAKDQTGDDFAALIDERLRVSGIREVYIYVHGFRVIFDDPVLVATELWHFLGYRGAFVAYAWPSTPRALAYMSDLETAKTMARKLRLFLTYLSDNTDVEKIHIIGFSAGSRLVVRALEQMALLNAEASNEHIRKTLRIGNVIIVGGDISRESFGAAVTDGMLRIPERTVVYVSSADTALAWSRWIFRRERLGEMWADKLPPRGVQFLQANPSLELIDVTDAAGSTLGNGHGYFRRSPWVSSDILTLLAFDLDPVQRGLEKGATRLVWSFPPDYIERLQKNLVKLHPELKGSPDSDTCLIRVSTCDLERQAGGIRQSHGYQTLSQRLPKSMAERGR